MAKKSILFSFIPICFALNGKAEVSNNTNFICRTSSDTGFDLTVSDKSANSAEAVFTKQTSGGIITEKFELNVTNSSSLSYIIFYYVDKNEGMNKFFMTYIPGIADGKNASLTAIVDGEPINVGMVCRPK